MAYWLEQNGGKYLGDLASNVGLMDLHRGAKTPKSVKKFLTDGIAEADLVEQMIEDLDGVEELGYLRKMLDGSEPPITVTDGCGHED